ncbi:fucolectin-7-like [Mytilus trossulus]|uniref:fucolectin-7-like n=1 Tax=Mytilus trossulus TaxID=6551 RepID=UPI0030041272
MCFPIHKGEGILVSQGKTTGQSSTYQHYESRLGVDGVKEPYNHFHTLVELEPFWWVNLGQVYKIQKVVSTNRNACNQCNDRLKKMVIYVGNSLDTCQMKLCGQFIGPAAPKQIIVTPCFALPEGQIVKLTSVNTAAPDYFHLSEVEVYGF